MEETIADKNAYRVMRCLGTVTGSICRGFCLVAPFMRSGKAEEEEAVPSLWRANEVAHDVELMDEKLEYEPCDTDDLLSGIDFEGNVQRMEVEVCIKDFRSKLATVRKEALGRISRLPPSIAIEILQRLLFVSRNSFMVIQVLNALSALNEHGNLDKRLFMDFLNDENPAVRLAALGAISKYKDEDSFSMLSAFLEDPSAQIRRQALNLLSWGYDDKSTFAVLSMLHDVDNHVRQTAIYLCASLKLREAISPLISFLSDSDNNIQERAVESLRKITGQYFSFKAFASAKNKKEAVEAWRSWWCANQASFGVG